MAKERLVHPKLDTPLPHSLGDSGTGPLPAALVSEQVERVAVCALVGAVLWTYGVVMDAVVRPLTFGSAVHPANIAIETAAMAVSVLMWIYVRFVPGAPGRKVDGGLVYFVLNAVAVALLNTWTRPVAIDPTVQLSWNTVVILLAAMIIPTSPGRMLIASLLAASMDPLAVLVAHARGLQVPSAVNTLVFYMPNYACAIVATLPSRVLQRLGRRLQQAQQMGSYRLTELLGRGGMGEVWRAHHRLLARSAAIKLVRPELLGASSEAEARNMLRRFEQEARATAALSSPHTIRVFDFGVTAERTFYYVMELLDGRDLESLVRDFGPLPAERAVFLLRQMCHSLADAHARGLVHRDVSPSNVYVCRLGLDYDFVKVLDFGLVRFHSDRSMEETIIAGPHTTRGTPAFMAPEILLDGYVDQRADVYAIGCVAYYLLTGQYVFDADTPMKMFVQHLQADPVRPSERTELPVPPDLEALVLRCLAKDPDRRPANASELLTLIDRCRVRATWDNEAARLWWERHVPELTEPLSVGEPSTALESALAV